MEFVNENQDQLEKRESGLYETEGDVRSAYFRDYNRILHSNAYRRLKHKTQVFFNINNDHICTRMEHVAHVGAVSHSIAVGLGLNTELTSAISCGHDLGHAPFGHQGETVLNDIMNEYLTEEYRDRVFGKDNKKCFWHEKNGLRFVDSIELLKDPYGTQYNLNLTYAVRDGIVSHCGEIDENSLIPRKERFNLSEFKKPGQFMPCTWEGCAVKISDKIAYLGRDIEDALTLNILDHEDKEQLRQIALKYCHRETLNTTGIMHSLIIDICQNSTPDKGICLSEEKLQLFNEIKNYNYKTIYKSSKFNTYKSYVELMLNSIFKKLYDAYEQDRTITKLIEMYGKTYPKLTKTFCLWLGKYCVVKMSQQLTDEWRTQLGSLANEKIYGGLCNRDIYTQAIVDYISGMTDAFAIMIFNELLSFS